MTATLWFTTGGIQTALLIDRVLIEDGHLVLTLLMGRKQRIPLDTIDRMVLA